MRVIEGCLLCIVAIFVHPLVSKSQQTAWMQSSEEQILENRVILVAAPENYNVSVPCYPFYPSRLGYGDGNSFNCTMQIYNATYGELCDRQLGRCQRTCRTRRDSKDLINRKCSVLTSNECRLEVGDPLLGAICPGRAKHLALSYSCDCVIRRGNTGSGSDEGAQQQNSGDWMFPMMMNSQSLCQHRLYENYMSCNG